MSVITKNVGELEIFVSLTFLCHNWWNSQFICFVLSRGCWKLARYFVSLSSGFPVRSAKGIMFNKYSTSGSYTAEQQCAVSSVFIEMYMV